MINWLRKNNPRQRSCAYGCRCSKLCELRAEYAAIDRYFMFTRTGHFVFLDDNNNFKRKAESSF